MCAEMTTPGSSNPKSNPRRETGRIGWIGSDFRRTKRHFNRTFGSRRNVVKALLIRRLWVQLPRDAPKHAGRRADHPLDKWGLAVPSNPILLSPVRLCTRTSPVDHTASPYMQAVGLCALGAVEVDGAVADGHRRRREAG